jgi:hypothetical protein
LRHYKLGIGACPRRLACAWGDSAHRPGEAHSYRRRGLPATVPHPFALGRKRVPYSSPSPQQPRGGRPDSAADLWHALNGECGAGAGVSSDAAGRMPARRVRRLYLVRAYQAARFKLQRLLHKSRLRAWLAEIKVGRCRLTLRNAR